MHPIILNSNVHNHFREIGFINVLLYTSIDMDLLNGDHPGVAFVPSFWVMLHFAQSGHRVTCVCVCVRVKW